MNYSDFMKSKHIAERWGEAQAALESTDQTPEVAYYQELLNDFYDYIQYLESKTFATNDEQANHEIIKDEVEKKSIRTQIEFPEPANDLVMPSVAETTPIEAIPVNFSDLLKENKEVVTDEEDPWFGFME